jgi:WXXGXW repeat (2 copies)
MVESSFLACDGSRQAQVEFPLPRSSEGSVTKKLIGPERRVMRILILIRALLVAVATLAVSGACFAQVDVEISVASPPPELPVYEQPMCPGDGYIWTPGYWAWDEDVGDYYWVPGTWVLAPQVGYFWTPSWWGWNGNAFIFHQGYWAPVVGYYGGINYGYGYSGQGYEGGRWEHDHFYYNQSVNNVNVTEVHNVYNTTVVNNYNSPRPSFNGPNGVSASPTAQQQAAMNEHHIAPVPAQTQHIQAARTDPQLRASANHGKPPIAATPKPAAFNEHGAVPAKAAGNYNPPPRSANKAPAATTNSNPAPNANPNANAHPIHPNDLPPHPRPQAPNTGNQEQDQKYQQQQKLYEQQQAEHQELQKKQDQEHQKLAQQQQDAAKKQQAQQQMEQKHQQETQQMEQKHAQQQQQQQAKPAQQPHEAPPPPEHENPKKPPQ